MLLIRLLDGSGIVVGLGLDDSVEGRWDWCCMLLYVPLDLDQWI